jgi:hypothetical protein
VLFAGEYTGAGVYLDKEQFIAESFAGLTPTAEKLWVDKEQKEAMAAILGHPYRGLRVRYWGAERRTAWIFDEIGKELPVTIGVVVEDDRIVAVRILVFRESRGGEVKYPFFTGQFEQLALDNELKLTGHIDGITGATLSVRAVKKVARLALYMHGLTGYALNNE